MKNTSIANLEQFHFFFVRHAETSWNAQKLCQGQKDIPLNEKGLNEAKTFALQTQRLNIPCIISSPLSRALQTAKAIHDIHSYATLHIIPELAERNWGDLEGISSEQMYEIERLEEEDPSYNCGRGVETRSDFRQRVLRGILKSQKQSPHPLIVSHGRVFMELCTILSIPPVRQLLNCQLVQISPNDAGWEASIIKKEL